jgi:hypothetical protein
MSFHEAIDRAETKEETRREGLPNTELLRVERDRDRSCIEH